MFVYGRNSVEEALRERVGLRRVVVEFSKKAKFASLVVRLQREGVGVEYLSAKDMSRLAGTQKHQGIVAEIDLPPTVYEDEDEFSGWEEAKVILMLDGLTDTGNVGAILRSALLLGVDVVVLPEDHSARITPQVIRASAGALYHLAVVYVRNIVRTTERLKQRGFCVYGLDMRGDRVLGAITFTKPLCLVVGSEDKGIRRMMRKACDGMIRIPTTEKLDSLNVSVATAICLWEVYTQLSGGQR
ncbi:MAG: 23S rRNA (guanosine(2251)-2'-O)-methyltransferase RlmB [Brevinematales bacterium]|nr:23S rRNA (guanosine(2251)-2'-O)-methyltransferase RlmB [Brevinematales bacterium]